MKKQGNILIISGFIFGIIETIYFGMHFLPSCIEESICDLLAIVLMCIGMYLKQLK